MFNEANVDNRSRHPVRGRVIVFTTSKVVEFLNKDLSVSIPLFSHPDPYPEKCGLVFMVELDGLLTFDEGSFYRVSDELASYERAYFDPNGAAVVRSGDVFNETVIVGAVYNYNDGICQVVVSYNSEAGRVDLIGQIVSPLTNVSDAHELVASTFVEGRPWKGKYGYPDFQFDIAQG